TAVPALLGQHLQAQLAIEIAHPLDHAAQNVPGEGRYLLLCTRRSVFSSHDEKSIGKRMDEVIGIKSTCGVTVCEIDKEEFQQLLSRGVLKIRSYPQFACWSTIQLRIDFVHERRVERTSNHLEVTSRAYQWTNPGRHERKSVGRPHVGHRIMTPDSSFEACRKTGTDNQNVL